MCAAAAKRFDASESYAHLLDTVFHLCPTGRSPASYRMNEALAAGAIPIFVSGDVRTGAPYGESWLSADLTRTHARIYVCVALFRRLGAARELRSSVAVPSHSVLRYC